jgi:epoxyqueuosine reductase
MQAEAERVGLDHLGVCSAEPFDRYLSELELRRDHYVPRFEPRFGRWRRMADPGAVLEGARAVVVVGFRYLVREGPPGPEDGVVGRIVSYGHLGLLRRARRIVAFLRRKGYRAVLGVHRKEAAVRAGLGAIGKNALVLNRDSGGWAAYQAIATDAPLEPDTPCSWEPCASCDACVKACPTGALDDPHRVDPRRCITAALTSSEIAPELRPLLGRRLLGCDACLEACPYNRAVQPKDRLASLFPWGIGTNVPLRLLLGIDEHRFQRTLLTGIFAKMAGPGLVAGLLRMPLVGAWLGRRILSGFQGRETVPETFIHASTSLALYKRNAIIAVANLGAKELRDDVRECMADPQLEPVAAWALGEIG